MQKVFLFLVFLSFSWGLFFSCDDQAKDVPYFVVPDTTFTKEIINGEIVSVIKEIIKVGEPKIFSFNGLYCITIEFLKEDLPYRGVSINDTVIVFSFYTSHRNYAGYKGIYVVNDYPVAIFDKDDIAHKYYDEATLLDYPLEKFKDIEVAFINNLGKHMRSISVFKFKNGFLYNTDFFPDSKNKYGL